MSKRSQEHAREFYGADSTGALAPALITDIPTQTDASGAPIATLAVAANFAPGNGVNPVYSANLPTGLTINVTTGDIDGTPTVIGAVISSVHLRTSNGVVKSNGFVWTIT